MFIVERRRAWRIEVAKSSDGARSDEAGTRMTSTSRKCETKVATSGGTSTKSLCDITRRIMKATRLASPRSRSSPPPSTSKV